MARISQYSSMEQKMRTRKKISTAHTNLQLTDKIFLSQRQPIDFSVWYRLNTKMRSDRFGSLVLLQKLRKKTYARTRESGIGKRRAHFTLNINLMIKSIKNVFALICMRKKKLCIIERIDSVVTRYKYIRLFAFVQRVFFCPFYHMPNRFVLFFFSLSQLVYLYCISAEKLRFIS